MVFPADFVGCRFKVVQHLRLGDVPRTHVGEERHIRRMSLVDAALALLPTSVSAGSWEETLECMAAGHRIIVDPVLSYTADGMVLSIEPEALIRIGEDSEPAHTWRYAPLIVSTHQVLYRDEKRTCQVIDTHRIGQTKPVTGHFAPRHHTLDGYRLSLSALALRELGQDSSVGFCVGQELTMAYVGPTEPLHRATLNALTAPLPQRPVRVKECAAGCRYWQYCEPDLIARDDISLVLPGGRADTFREKGIETVQGLIDADLGQPSQIAQAWREGIVAMKKHDQVTAPRFDVEIDIDLEAYMGAGVYLWGTYDGSTYTPFVTWEELGGEAEARNFAELWTYLQDMRASAPQSFAAFCFANGGENHWLRRSARRFAPLRDRRHLHTLPTVEEVEQFIASPQWIDVFKLVKSQLVGTNGLGLKTVAPLAGFTYADEDVNGEASLELYDAGERERLLAYNRDDCVATAKVRHWLANGAPGIPLL